MTDDDPPSKPSLTPADHNQIAKAMKAQMPPWLNGHSNRYLIALVTLVVGVPGLGLYRSETATRETGAEVAAAVRENTVATKRHGERIDHIDKRLEGHGRRLEDVSDIARTNARQNAALTELVTADTEPAPAVERIRRVRPAAERAKAEAARAERLLRDLERERGER